MAELDQMVMRMVSETYGVEKSYETLLGSTSYLLRLIKYREPQENETNLGIVPHTDKSFMSILQQHQVKGLEIKTKDGRWMEIDPFPSSFIIMAGEAFMVSLMPYSSSSLFHIHSTLNRILTIVIHHRVK